MAQPDRLQSIDLTGCDKLLDVQLRLLAEIRTAYVEGGGILSLVEREIARVQAEKRERETRATRISATRDEWGGR